MRLLIEAHHPAHIHFFKNPVRLWRDRGDEVLLLGRDRDVMKQLLGAYSFIPSRVVTGARGRGRFPLREMLERQAAVASAIREFQPTLVLSLMGSYTQAARLFGVPNIIFTDSEFQSFNHRIAHPFATRIYTPQCFWKPLGDKQRRYNGYHELAFLHPARFTPRPEVLSRLSVNGGPSVNGAGGGTGAPAPGQYVVIRTSAWNTLHDIGESGLGKTFDAVMREALAKYSVYVVPEGGKIAPEWERYKLTVPPEDYHDVLAFARLVITEGASTASEAACLGVPSVYINTTRRGYLEDQERRYRLVFNYTDADAAARRVSELLARPPSAEDTRSARERLVGDHVDVTSYVVDELDRLAKELGLRTTARA
jgi:predicted glycosyltransferase